MPISGSHASDVHRAGAGVIPFGGGKGGVGKTFLVANLATALARQGHRVVAVDGDLEGANLHTCLGVQRPRASLADYVAHREEDLQKLLLDTHLPNLALIAATRSHLGSAQPSHSRFPIQGTGVIHNTLTAAYPRNGRSQRPAACERPPVHAVSTSCNASAIPVSAQLRTIVSARTPPRQRVVHARLPASKPAIIHSPVGAAVGFSLDAMRVRKT